MRRITERRNKKEEAVCGSLYAFSSEWITGTGELAASRAVRLRRMSYPEGYFDEGDARFAASFSRRDVLMHFGEMAFNN